MGQTMPQPQPISTVLAPDSGIGERLLQDFTECGFAVIQPTDAHKTLVNSFCKSGAEFFCAQEEQRQTKAPPPGYPEYKYFAGKKEYCKMNLAKGVDHLQSPGLVTPFADLSKQFLDISNACFRSLSAVLKARYPSNILDTEVILDIAKDYSSLSLIHYFKKPESEHSTTNKDTNPSEPHCDTGLLTFGVVLDVPGLQIQCKKTKEWIKVEEVYPPYSIVCWPGEKIPLFLGLHQGQEIISATTHQVILDQATERTACIFLFDCSP